VTTLRALGADDRPLLVTATLGNLNWVGERFTVQDVLSRPEFAHYVEVDLARGDFGVVAQDGDRATGVAWAVFLPDGDPGYGFVAPDVPEVSVWVDAACRGRGVGRRLLRELQAEAARRGLRAVSLSVEEGNRARDLYAALGFVPVPGREAGEVMLWSSAGG
jgi:ribosomal protein S18 acetylase RimI-like enzyme